MTDGYNISDPEQFKAMLQRIEWEARKAAAQGRPNPFVKETVRNQ